MMRTDTLPIYALATTAFTAGHVTAYCVALWLAGLDTTPFGGVSAIWLCALALQVRVALLERRR